MDARDEQYFAETRPVRLIAVANRINLKAAVTEQSFSAELERIVGMAVPYLVVHSLNV